MTKRRIWTIALIASPVILLSVMPVYRLLYYHIGRARAIKLIAEWNSLPFDAITNADQREKVADAIVLKTTALDKNDDSGPYSKDVLKQTLLHLLGAFSAPDGVGVDYNNMQGHPDLENYAQFRGFNIDGKAFGNWNTQELNFYEDRLGTPQKIRKWCLPFATNVPGNGKNETPDAIHMLEWLAAIYDTPLDPKRRIQGVYCNGHWVGICSTDTTFCVTNISPKEFLNQRPHIERVIDYEPSFRVSFPDSSGEHLLFATVVHPNSGFIAHPIAISLRWLPTARRWMPAELASGTKVEGVNYIW